MKIAILGTRGIPNNYGGFEQCAEFLSVGLAERGHEVTVYSPHFHTYKETKFKHVTIIKKRSPENIFGVSAANFIYDYLCFKDAVKKDFDIILQLGLITSALSLILCRHKGKIVVTNIDGLEWKRKKWSKIIQILTKKLEKFGISYSDYLIADNQGIQQYLKQQYGRESQFIAYGAQEMNSLNKKILARYAITSKSYLLSIARLEPENNLETLFDAYLESSLKYPYYIVGKHTTSYGDYLKDKYRSSNIIFLGPIYDKSHLDNLRYYSTLYLHGHSVGGTNPSLLEAMATKCLIVAHKNSFNISVLEKNAFYFKNKKDLATLLRSDLLSKKEKFSKNNLAKVKTQYNWNKIVDDYESYFFKISS